MGRPPKKTQEEVAIPKENEKPPEFVDVRFKWLEARPDKRQYNQQTLLLEPYQTWVTVKVPNTPVYMSVVDKFSAEVQPELTPAGLRYCMDRLDEVFTEKPLKWEGEETESDSSDSWDEEIVEKDETENDIPEEEEGDTTDDWDTEESWDDETEETTETEEETDYDNWD